MHMRKLLVKDLHPGMITAEDIFSIDGQLILPKKIILTQNGIEKLEAFAIYLNLLREYVRLHGIPG